MTTRNGQKNRHEVSSRAPLILKNTASWLFRLAVLNLALDYPRYFLYILMSTVTLMLLQVMGMLAVWFGIIPLSLYACALVPAGGPLGEVVAPYVQPEIAPPAVAEPATPQVFFEETQRIHQRYSALLRAFGRYNIPHLRESYFLEETDARLWEAHARGGADLLNCVEKTRVELDCLERQGQLHQRLYGMLRTHPASSSFLDNTPAGVRETVEFTCGGENMRVYPGLSLEVNLRVRATLQHQLDSLQARGHADPLFMEALHLARTGGFPRE